jgi:hypothetical protein
MWLVLALIAFVFTVVIHALIVRVGGPLTIVMRFLAVGMPVGLVLTYVALAMLGLRDESIAAIATYAILCEIYLFLFTLAANGVAVSLLLRLRSGPLKPEAFDTGYAARDMVERRVDQLQAAGFLSVSGGRSSLLPRGRRLVRAFILARAFFGHDRVS